MTRGLTPSTSGFCLMPFPDVSKLCYCWDGSQGIFWRLVHEVSHLLGMQHIYNPHLCPKPNGAMLGSWTSGSILRTCPGRILPVWGTCLYQSSCTRRRSILGVFNYHEDEWNTLYIKQMTGFCVVLFGPDLFPRFPPPPIQFILYLQECAQAIWPQYTKLMMSCSACSILRDSLVHAFCWAESISSCFSVLLIS